MSQSSQQRVGQYNFLRKLGAGRIAEVYLGRIDGAEGFQKPVAIKKILPELASDPAFVQSLIAEAKIGGQLHHRNIVEVYDFIRYDDEYCIIMEYVEGVDLSRILRAARQYRIRIPPAAALYIISQICDGLDYAHAARGFSGEPLSIIHRDLKPSNVLISTKGGVKISDFGVARVVEQALQKIGTLGSASDSLYYQSPEQVSAADGLTPASDIFSVGAVFFELLTLEPLIPGESVTQTLANLKERDLARRLSLAQRALPGAEKILATALHPNPARRYRSASLMGEDIRRLLAYLRVDDPRERLISFFWRLVRFIREKSKEAPAGGGMAERDQAEAWSPMGTHVTSEGGDADADGMEGEAAAASAAMASDLNLPGQDEHTPVEPIQPGSYGQPYQDDYGEVPETQAGYGGEDYAQGGGYEAADAYDDSDYGDSEEDAPAYADGAAVGAYDDGQSYDDGQGYDDYGEHDEAGWEDPDLAATQEPETAIGPGPNETVLGGYSAGIGEDDPYGVNPDVTSIRPPTHVDEAPGDEPYDPDATYLRAAPSIVTPHGDTQDFQAAGSGEVTGSVSPTYGGNLADAGEHTAAIPPPSFGGGTAEAPPKEGGNAVKAVAVAAVVLIMGAGAAFAYLQFGSSGVSTPVPPIVITRPKEPEVKQPVAVAPTATPQSDTAAPGDEAKSTPRPSRVASVPRTGSDRPSRVESPSTPRPSRVPVVQATPTPRPYVDPYGSYVAPKATPKPTPTATPFPVYTPTPRPAPTATAVPVKATPVPPKATPEAVAKVPVDTRSAAEILQELFSDETASTARAQKGQLSPAEVGALASVPKSEEDKYTSSRSYMALHYKATGNMSEYGNALNAMLEVPTNQYNPTIRLEQSEYLLTQRRFPEAIEAASVAERYRQKFPKGEIYYTRLARTYEVLAKSYEGKFTSSEDPEDLDQAIRMWERYMTHVERKADQKRIKMAQENIEKLERIKERVN